MKGTSFSFLLPCFYSPSSLFPALAAPLSRDPSSIRLNSSSKPSTPPHPSALCVSRSSLFWFYELDVLCLLYATIRHSKVKSKAHTNAPASSSSSCCCALRPRWVEQKVVDVSSPLGHNGRRCAAPTECNMLFWRQQGPSTERYWLAWPPSRQTILLFTLMECCWILWLCPFQWNDCVMFFHFSVYWNFNIGK